MSLEMLLAQFDGVIETAKDVNKLEQKILQLAVRGKLVPQCPSEEPSSLLLKQIVEQRDNLLEEGEIRKRVNLKPVSSEEIPFDIPDEWEWARFGQLVAFNLGKTPKTKESRYWQDDGIPWVSISDLNHLGTVRNTARKISEPAAEEVFRNQIVPAGTLLMSFKLTVGKVSILEIDAYHNEAIIAIHPYDGVSQDYLFHFLPLLSLYGTSKDAIKGATLNSKSLAKLLIPLPPYEEQKRIVAKVDELLTQTRHLTAELQQANTQRRKVFTSMTHHLTHANGAGPAATWPLLAANFDRLLAGAEMVDELKQAILQLAVQGRLAPQDPNDEPANTLLERIAAERQKRIEAGEIRKTKREAPDLDKSSKTVLPAGWVLCSLSDIILYLQTGPFGSNLHKSDYVSEGIPVINPSDMRDGRIIRSGAKMVDPITLARLSSYKLLNGDVVMARRGEMGRCGVVTEKEDGWLCGTGSLILRLTNHTYQPYMIMLIQSESTRAYLRDGSVGATMSNLNQRVLLKMPVALPPYQEQKRVVAKVDELLALCDRLTGQLTSTHTARKHLLDAILTQAHKRASEI